MNKNYENSVVIKDSNWDWKKKIFLFMIFVLPILVLYIINEITLDSLSLSLSIMFIISVLILTLVIDPESNKSIINDKGIEFYIKENHVFSCKWSELEQITFQKEMVHYPPEHNIKEHTNNEYVIHLLGANIDKTIRLWYFPFRVKNQELIIQSIKRLAGAINILKLIELPEDKDLKICDRNYDEMHHILYDKSEELDELSKRKMEKEFNRWIWIISICYLGYFIFLTSFILDFNIDFGVLFMGISLPSLISLFIIIYRLLEIKMKRKEDSFQNKTSGHLLYNISIEYHKVSKIKIEKIPFNWIFFVSFLFFLVLIFFLILAL